MTRKIVKAANIATMELGGTAYGLVADGAIGIEDGRIAWVGKADAFPADWRGATVEDCGDRLVTPALIDCHTHLVFGGNRAKEFEMRLEGATYEAIARAGGGIAPFGRRRIGLADPRDATVLDADRAICDETVGGPARAHRGDIRGFDDFSGHDARGGSHVSI
jgi:imidazolonepropionase-like amidohydrolase